MNEDTNLPFDSAAYEVACARKAADPLALTPRDFELFALVSPGLVRDAQNAQAFAQRERDRLALQVKSASPEAPKTLDEFCQRYGKGTVTWAGLTKVLQETDAVLVKELKALRVRADALEKANTDLQNRVLELEAQHAAALGKVDV